jgi:hypothetical protein
MLMPEEPEKRKQDLADGSHRQELKLADFGMEVKEEGSFSC